MQKTAFSCSSLAANPKRQQTPTSRTTLQCSSLLLPVWRQNQSSVLCSLWAASHAMSCGFASLVLWLAEQRRGQSATMFASGFATRCLGDEGNFRAHGCCVRLNGKGTKVVFEVCFESCLYPSLRSANAGPLRFAAMAVLLCGAGENVASFPAYPLQSQ